MVKVVETWLYRPVARLFGMVVMAAKRLQSGRLDAYLLYMLIALVAVIMMVTARSRMIGRPTARLASGAVR